MGTKAHYIVGVYNKQSASPFNTIKIDLAIPNHHGETSYKIYKLIKTSHVHKDKNFWKYRKRFETKIWDKILIS